MSDNRGRCVLWDYFPLRPGAQPPLWWPGDPMKITRGKMYLARNTCGRYTDNKLVNQQTSDRRQVYFPTEADLNTIVRRYPDMEPALPDWSRIRADLVEGGAPAADLAAMDVPMLLKTIASGTRSAWITVTEAADLASVNKATISRKAGDGQPIRDNGKSRHERRVNRDDVAAWATERNIRARQPDDEESEVEVMRKMRQAGL